MTDQNTLDRFEQRVAAELERYVAGAADPRPAAEIADVAMRPRGIQGRVGGNLRSRRLLLFGIAAVLLVPAAFGVGALLRQVPDPINQIQPAIATALPSFDADATPGLTDEMRAIVVRRTPDKLSGVSIYAVRPDGAERLLREVPGSVLPDGHRFQEWGLVSQEGWIALAEEQNPWRTVIVDLRDPQSEPWLVPDSTAGGSNISPAWGPQGFLAVLSGTAMEIVDPESRSVVRHIPGAGIGGGPSIIWTADGSGIVDGGNASYGVQPIDGSRFQPGFPDIFGTRGGYGNAGAGLRVCSAGENCPDGDDGRVVLQQLDGTATTIYEPTGGERATAAIFGAVNGVYFVQLDSDAGRQIAIDRVRADDVERIAVLDRPIDWVYFGVNQAPTDESMLVFFVDRGDDRYGIAVMPPASGAATFHDARFAGYLSSLVADAAGDASYRNTGTEVVGPGSESTYPMRPIADLIEAEMNLNPGRVVVGQASHDAVDGDSEAEEYAIAADVDSSPEIYLDCFGPDEVEITFGIYSVTNPCLGGGTFIGTLGEMGAGDVATLTASHDTSWRVVLYTMEMSPGDTPPPIAEPVTP